MAESKKAVWIGSYSEAFYDSPFWRALLEWMEAGEAIDIGMFLDEVEIRPRFTPWMLDLMSELPEGPGGESLAFFAIYIGDKQAFVMRTPKDTYEIFARPEHFETDWDFEQEVERYPMD